jgi:pyruvate kinase
MNVARLNMSHGDHPSHEQDLENLRQASQEAGLPVTAFIDLQGPKIRLGTFGAGPVTIVDGDRFTITTEDVLGDQQQCSTTFKGMPTDVKAGDCVLIDDGRIELKAVEVTATDVVCEVVHGGQVSDHKGINLPGVAVSIPALTEKDADDLRWGLANGIDMVALSFVRSADDIVLVHEIMDEVGRRVPVIAKIEKPQALDNLEAIIDAFDAFMVARGDLGVELPFEDVPLAQKRIINAARTWAKPVIVATQMLESMISAPRPTRAEASDVANAIMDGADAVMLSGETAVGQYPVEAVTAMEKIITAIEDRGFNEIDHLTWDPHTTSGVVAWGAASIAQQLNVKYLVGFSLGGDTVRRLSRLRTKIPVFCFTPSEKTRQELGLVWGVRSFLSSTHELDSMIAEMDQTLLAKGLAEPGDLVVAVYGVPMGVTGRTNSLQVHRVAAGV